MKKIKFLFLIIGFTLFLTGCKEEKLNESYYIIEDVVQFPEQEEEKDEEILTADKTVLKLYYPDETKQFILSKLIEVEQINKETIEEHILELGYVDEFLRLFDLTGEVSQDQEKYVIAEFSTNLLEQLENQDAAEGQIVFACIINTILDAYDAAGVSIRVENTVLVPPIGDIELEAAEIEEGEKIELPEGYFSYFELTYKDTIDKTVLINQKSEDITYTRFFCEEGYSVYYETNNYTSVHDKTEGVAAFEKNNSTTSFCIYLSETSKVDTIDSLINQEEPGVKEISESLNIEIGVEGYLSTGIFKRGGNQVSNYYVIEKEGQIYVIEVKMEDDVSIEDGAHIAEMLDTFQIIN